MTTDEALALTEAEAADPATVIYSAAWWERRTAEELRDIINRGFCGGDVFSSAVAETERRARDATKRLREAAARDARYRKRRLMLATAATTAVIAASFVGAWYFY